MPELRFRALSQARLRPAFLVFVLLVAALACRLPFGEQPTPQPTTPAVIAPSATAAPSPTPTPTPLPLPPAIVESNPPPGAETSQQEGVILYFNQAMDQASVEQAVGLASGGGGAEEGEVQLTTPRLEWLDDATLRVAPAEPLEAGQTIHISVGVEARSAQGLALSEPLSLSYQAAGPLLVTQLLPEPGAAEVDPTSAIVAAFNRPVVALGADQAALPPAFTISGSPGGRGEWLNTSTYIFYPEPGLGGGATYTVTLNPDLASVDGGLLEGETDWSFSTASPRLEGVSPSQGTQHVRLDAPVRLSFNQPMDAASVEAGFRLAGPDGAAVAGAFTWEESGKTLVFQPGALLQRGGQYTVTLDGQASSPGGASLGTNASAVFQTAGPLAVVGTRPAAGEHINVYEAPSLIFSAPINETGLRQRVTVTPDVPGLNLYWYAEERNLYTNGAFAPNTTYTITVSADLTDIWGSRLGESTGGGDYTFTFTTLPLDPGLQIPNSGSGMIYLTPQNASLPAQATNLPGLFVSSAALSTEEFLRLAGPNGYELRGAYQPAGMRTWEQAFSLAPDQTTTVELNLNPEGTALAPGFYLLRYASAQFEAVNGAYLLVVSRAHLTLKESPTDALVWAVDLQSSEPLANAPVSIYSEAGELRASGQSDAEGIFRSELEQSGDLYGPVFALLGQPGEAQFGFASSTWNEGISPYQFGIGVDRRQPRLQVYLYSDRPIYRPGQTIYFRAVVRHALNGRYSLSELQSLPLALHDGNGQRLATFDLPLSAFGTAHGEFTLPAAAPPGWYNLYSSIEGIDAYLSIQVANYRKPEVNLQVSFPQADVLAGDALQAEIEARYFFDAPAGNTPLRWTLYAGPAYFDLPTYQTGPVDFGWLDAFRYFQFAGPYGSLVAQGEASTGPDGRLSLELPAAALEDGEAPQKQVYTLEVTLTDASGQPVSARASLNVHPAPVYIGVRPESWTSQAGEEMAFEIFTAGWDGQPLGERSLRAEFRSVVWERQDPAVATAGQAPGFTAVYTPIASTDLRTGADGRARVAFTPPEPGVYQVDVYGLEADSENAITQALIWVGGPGQASWPDLPNQRLNLTADRSSYQPGDTAQVFVPNPYGQAAQALVTVERGIIMSYQVITLEANGSLLDFPLDGDSAPNVYISVTLLGKTAGGQPDFRLGYLELEVEPVEQTLNVQFTGSPARAGPGDEVQFEILVTDSTGQPVQGEFSLSVVDLAVLALADPNAPAILPAFYARQPLSINTGLSLAAYARRLSFSDMGGGGGGGGGADVPTVRADFPDTAYWNAEVVTGADGRALVSVTLPDSLTTWQVQARGLTADTRVGEAETQVVTTQDLIVRPVTPRFLVEGDHTQLAAVVHNNTTFDLQATVSLHGGGFDLDEPITAIQQALIPAGGQARVEWWGTAQQAEAADLTFSAEAQADKADGGQTYQDSTRPAGGALPILRFQAHQAFRTAGVLDEAGQRLELVSLPRTGDPAGLSGALEVELSPSLAAALLPELEALNAAPYTGAEATLSAFLPNLEAYRALEQFGIEAPQQSNLERRLAEGVQRLVSSQNWDGGWGWWPGGESHAHISAYVLYGLSRAQASNFAVDENVITRAIEYVRGTLPAALPEGADDTGWELDRLAFAHYALAHAGAGDLAAMQALYARRSELSDWAQAVLALSIEQLSPGDALVTTLISDLEAAAIRSAAGSHWEARNPGWPNLANSLTNSAFVVYALAQREPGSPLLADAVRYLMANRQAGQGWRSTYTSAWTIMALAEYMKGSGELGGDFAFGAALNGATLLQGQAGGRGSAEGGLTAVTGSAPLSSLYPDSPNALLIERQEGNGRLYYSAILNASRPVGEAAPVAQGLHVSRAYSLAGDDCPPEGCPLNGAPQVGQKVIVRLALTLPNDMHNLLVEDYLPAGAEILNSSLKTSELGAGQGPEAAVVDPRSPFGGGWGWWYFHPAQIFDDHITWAADYLLAGSYELTYTLVLLQPGEFGVLPARAWQFYFPEVYANSAGDVFTIQAP